MKEKPKDFEITKESGITIKEESFFPEGDMPAMSNLKDVHLESREYGNSKYLTLEFERRNSSGKLPKARIGGEFLYKDTAQEVSAKLISMITEIHRLCIEAPELKSEG
jgi:hypothetical protein